MFEKTCVKHCLDLSEPFNSKTSGMERTSLFGLILLLDSNNLFRNMNMQNKTLETEVWRLPVSHSCCTWTGALVQEYQLARNDSHISAASWVCPVHYGLVTKYMNLLVMCGKYCFTEEMHYLLTLQYSQLFFLQ